MEEIIISAIALAVSFFAAIFSIFTHISTVKRDRKQATLDAYNLLQEQVFDKIVLIPPSEMKEIAKNSRSEKYKEVSGYLARIEHFCVGVNMKIYDFNTFYELAHGFFDGRVKNRLEPMLESKQKSSDDYYNNISKVLSQMKARSESKKH